MNNDESSFSAVSAPVVNADVEAACRQSRPNGSASAIASGAPDVASPDLSALHGIPTDEVVSPYPTTHITPVSVQANDAPGADVGVVPAMSDRTSDNSNSLHFASTESSLVPPGHEGVAVTRSLTARGSAAQPHFSVGASHARDDATTGREPVENGALTLSREIASSEASLFAVTDTSPVSSILTPNISSGTKAGARSISISAGEEASSASFSGVVDAAAATSAVADGADSIPLAANISFSPAADVVVRRGAASAAAVSALAGRGETKSSSVAVKAPLVALDSVEHAALSASSLGSVSAAAPVMSVLAGRDETKSSLVASKASPVSVDSVEHAAPSSSSGASSVATKASAASVDSVEHVALSAVSGGNDNVPVRVAVVGGGHDTSSVVGHSLSVADNAEGCLAAEALTLRDNVIPSGLYAESSEITGACEYQLCLHVYQLCLLNISYMSLLCSVSSHICPRAIIVIVRLCVSHRLKLFVI